MLGAAAVSAERPNQLIGWGGVGVGKDRLFSSQEAVI